MAASAKRPRRPAAPGGEPPRAFGPLRVHHLTPERWPDLERLFGERGAVGGCWCMYWRLPRSRYEAGKGASNKRALRRIVAAGRPCGLLGYREKEPVGWIAFAPRQDYAGLGRSRILQPVDDLPVWSVTCFFIARPARGTGVSVALLEAAARSARRQGARILEGYPTEPRGGRMADVFAFTGTAAAFRSAGFREVARRSDTRPIMRLDLNA